MNLIICTLLLFLFCFFFRYSRRRCYFDLGFQLIAIIFRGYERQYNRARFFFVVILRTTITPRKRLPRFPISRFLDIETVVRHLCVRGIEHFPVNNRNRNNMKFIDRRCRRVKMCSPKIQSISYC